MTIVAGYTDRLTIKQRLGDVGVAQDDRIDAIITAVSRWIDSECEGSFVKTTGTRYYTSTSSSELRIDDFTALTTLKTDADGDGVYEITWAATDYRLEPVNARLMSPAQPYTEVCRSLYGRYSFPTGIPNGVSVTGDFGFDVAVPAVIAEACIIQVSRLFRRSDAPFGIVGSADMGQSVIIGRMDPDVRMLLAPYKKWHVA